MLEFNATFIIAMFSFVVFIIIMNMIFYKPILGIIEKRKNFIDENYNDANNSKERAKNLLEEKDKKIDETMKKSRKMIFNKTEEANEKSKEILSTTKKEISEEIQIAKENLHKEEISLDMNSNIDEIADSISKKLLGEV